MHIKQVIIRGFKTYKDQTLIPQEFDQGVNVVVGYNGSGKSNFFNAILFVISDRFGSLRNEMRKSLLHEGSGPAVLTAFVEIVFDNSDKRMPMDKDEVRIRRTIAAKKDDYTLDGRSATRGEVFKLLESCGFAKSNPYYIVQQGRVAELTLMTDANRLDLLKDISGASTYDDRRSDCTRILEDLRVKREKTDSVVEVVRRRIHALEDEQKELRQYQKLEQQRRCLEFVMTDRDWKATQDRIDALESQKTEASAKVHKVQRDLASCQEQAAEADADVFQVSAKKAQLEAKRLESERLRGLRVEELTRARLEYEDEKSKAKAVQKATDECRAEKGKIQEQMQAIQRRFEEGLPQLENRQAELRNQQHRKNVAQVERDSLLAKQGRGSHYNSVQQRNKFLSDQITSREQKRAATAKAAEECVKGLKDLDKKQDKCKKDIEEKKAAIKALNEELSQKMTAELEMINSNFDIENDRRRQSLQQREALVRDKEEAGSRKEKLNSRLEGTMPRPVRSALAESIQQVTNQGFDHQVFGTLLSNIKVPVEYQVAVESAAGNALFNLLVETDDIAAEIVKFVRQQQLGSITCTPLNQLRPRTREYPKIRGCKPLVDVIECPDNIRPAVMQVFGRTMVCSTIELCDTVSHKHGLDAVTIDGDRVSSQGSMTGGYQDPARYVRLKLAGEKREAEEQLSAIEEQLINVERQVKVSAQTLEQLHKRKRDAHNMRQTKRSALAAATESLHDLERDLRRMVEAHGRQKEREHELNSCLAEFDAAIEALNREKTSKTLGELTGEEHAKIAELTKELQDLCKTLETEEDECHRTQRELRGQEQHLNGYLRRRFHEIEAELLRHSQLDHQENEKEKERSVLLLTKQVEGIELDMETAANQIKELEATLTAKKTKHDALQKQVSTHQATLSSEIASVDDITSRIGNLTKKKGEYDEKLRKLTIVAAELEKYKRMETPALVDALRNANKDLAGFEHVNKKAIDQFATFQDQLKDLEDEGAEITRSQEAIQKFIEEVDAKKEHLLNDVLSQVDKHFQDVFRELVRDGSAKLDIVTSIEEDIDTVQASKKRKGASAAPEMASGIKGVKIEVSFSGQQKSFLQMSQLSGGQKTVVALALIFAMQRLEPAPFYLFDEVDAALDTQYRTALAQLLKKDATNGVQIIVTTFRPEIIDVANRCYRVSMRNRVSMIDSVEYKEAKEVVEMQAQQEGHDD